MLAELRVKDLGIIEDMDWKPGAGFNVVTGETGAGKSLIIDAIELLLTGSAGDDVIRTGANEARVEGVFQISSGQSYFALKNYIADKGLPGDDDVLIISFEIRKGRTGSVRINGHSVPKGVLRRAGQLLIDIHGQSQHLSLLEKESHLNFLDAFAKTNEMRNDFASGVARLQEIESRLHALEQQEKDRLRQEDFLRYQIDEIRNARLLPEEDIELEKERRVILQSEKLKECAQQVYESVDDRELGRDSSSALSRLNQAIPPLRKLVEMDASLKPQLDLFEEAVYDLEEIARDIHSYGDRLGSDPRRIEEIESRWEQLSNLKRKYGRSVADILVYLEKAEEDLAAISRTEEQRVQLIQERDRLKEELGILAGKLSAQRSQAASRLNNEVGRELDELEMSQMRFEVSLGQTVSPEGLNVDGKTFAFRADGIDDVDFMVSTNPGEPLKPLVRIASTGEISRFTLALKSALSEADSIPVLIFDEIDIGVGGRSGDILGRKLWRLAQNHQVICVTHLPQIAAYADSHFCVTKKSTGERTSNTLNLLEGEEKLGELALMLSGAGHSRVALKNAEELQIKAGDWKKTSAASIKKPVQLSF